MCNCCKSALSLYQNTLVFPSNASISAWNPISVVQCAHGNREVESLNQTNGFSGSRISKAQRWKLSVSNFVYLEIYWVKRRFHLKIVSSIWLHANASCLLSPEPSHTHFLHVHLDSIARQLRWQIEDPLRKPGSTNWIFAHDRLVASINLFCGW